MKTAAPNTSEMDAALLSHAAGGPAVYKGPLYVHAEREACARANGCATWAEYEIKKDREVSQFWNDLMAGGIK